ncbi:MAG: energy-coupling factor transporter ATPase [Actinomycetia bacterium]|nr:energy-coupling factor transporter ATPase [Actinomycetes bacterium]
MDLVEVEELTYSYPGRDRPALEGVDLRLSPGEFVLLLGSSGSGKSTLCRSLNGLVPHFYGGKISGKVTVAGKDTLQARVKDLSRHVGMVFQDPENQLVTESPVSEVAFGLENMGLDPATMRKRVEEVLATLRLSSLKGKKISELSGGQKQKVALASVLVMHPEVLVLDEPTSQLDPISADDFLSTLKSLNDELGLSVLLVEHRVERCFHFADRVIVLEKGRVAFSGTPAEMSAWAAGKSWAPLPPITRLFLDRDGADAPITVKQGRERVRALAGDACFEGGRRGRPEATPFEGGLSGRPCVDEAAPERRGSRNRPFEGGLSGRPCVDEAAPERRGSRNRPFEGGRRGRPNGRGGETPLVEVRNVSYVYGDGTEALKGIDLTVAPGEFIAVIGENGSGKSTLVKHFNGLLKPGRGKVLLDGKSTKGQEVARLARTCGMLGQNPNNQLVADTTGEEIEATLEALEIPEESRARLTDGVLQLLELEPFLDDDPRDLSCGERERVALASVLVYEPRLLVLDEPTRGVDQETKNRLAGYLAEYHFRGNAVVLVTHDLEFAASCCERVILMGDGRILADGDKHRVLSESLFFTTQFNKTFREAAPGVVTGEEAARALEALR